MPDRFDTLLYKHLPRRCQATTRAGRQCKNWAHSQLSFCRVHADWATASEPVAPPTLNVFLSHQLLYTLVDAGTITLEQLALVRVGIVGVVGLTTWLLSLLLMWVGTSWFHLPLALWYTASFAFLLTCWLLGRIVGPSNTLVILSTLFLVLLSILLDFFSKDGLILNICFVLIPFALPTFILYRYELALWWGGMFFPIGLFVGKLYYSCLAAASA